MPCYEYRCAENGRTVEVRHAMDEILRTWEELCARVGEEVGATPAGASVERLISAPVPIASGGDAEGCGPACACARRA